MILPAWCLTFELSRRITPPSLATKLISDTTAR